MSLLSVYVEGAKDPSPQGVKRLAMLIASRYGLPATDLEKRIAAGRFRVKANVDEATANAFAADLDGLGAHCSISAGAASAGAAGATTHPPRPAAASQPPAPAVPSSSSPRAPPAPTAPPAAPPAPAAPVGPVAVGAGRSGGVSRQPLTVSSSAAASPAAANPPGAGSAARPAATSAAAPGPVARAPEPSPAPGELPGRGALPSSAPVRESSTGLRAARRTAGSSLVPDAPPTSRTTTLPLGGAPVRPAAAPGNGPTGLAAALAEASYQPGGLGALETSSFSLATIDGREDPPTTPRAQLPAAPGASLAAAPGASPGSSLAAGGGAWQVPTLEPLPPVPSRSGAQPTAVPIDLFAPPDQGEDLQVELLEEVRPRRGSLAPRGLEARVTQGAPPAGDRILHGPEGTPMMSPAIAPAPRRVEHGATSLRGQRRERGLLAAGVLLAVFLGFVPVHVMARSREHAAFETIDNRVRAAQSEISSMEEWKALDELRAARFRQKRAAHQEIAFLSALLWVAISAGLSIGWARVVMPKLSPDLG